MFVSRPSFIIILSPRKTTAEKMIEVKNRLVESLGVLSSIWDDIGLIGDQKEERVDLVFMYIK